MFVDFIGVALDQLYNQAAKMKYMFGGKAADPHGYAHIMRRRNRGARPSTHNREALFMHLPGLKVVMPSTPYDAKGLLIEAIRDDNPVVFLNIKCFMPWRGKFPTALTPSPWPGRYQARGQGRHRRGHGQNGPYRVKRCRKACRRRDQRGGGGPAYFAPWMKRVSRIRPKKTTGWSSCTKR